jgi:hypothetical protein
LKPETVIRCAGFRLYWRWKSWHRGGRPTVPLDIRALIREMSIANPLWGAQRIHGELLKLGIEIGQTSVAKYIVGQGCAPIAHGSEGRAYSSPSKPGRPASPIYSDLICDRHTQYSRASERLS